VKYVKKLARRLGWALEGQAPDAASRRDRAGRGGRGVSFDYRDKVIVVTGGAGGIARAFAGEAAHAARPRSRRHPLRSRRTPPPRCPVGPSGFAGDLTDDDQVERVLGEIEEAYGRIDVLINNVGMTSAERFDARSVASIRLETEVNLLSPLVLTRLALPLLHRSRDPRVITTVSLGASSSG
jgi:NAD(P)-dependent dehydrogenase (short-subunit alcohol dehydrogenase family)